MTIYIASDHAGFELKSKLVSCLKNQGLEVIDKGPFEYVETDDYPDFISLVAKEISKNPKKNRGIILGGSGQGEAMVANRFKGVRAMVYHGGPSDIIKVSREHNDSNILSLGARFITKNEALKAVDVWLKTPFSNEERHIRRIKKIDLYPNA
ncbi:MAG: RpiB/LacA/LacB family sugar-phosphate isomerase [Parcubacteria group bacterium]|nr:RpiB/LacA/LacB family sugar-phosphate isomerase [Parcubacteria group bacterium]